MSTTNSQLEARLWGVADELRANSKLRASDYSIPVLGQIFLRYADEKLADAQNQLDQQDDGRELHESVASWRE